jgi:Family of unknown function (DUF6370)
MRSLFALAIGITALSFSLVAIAEDKKADKKAETKKLEGKLTCTKCALQETDKCGHALKVKDGDKEVIYYLDDKGGAEKYHGKVCKEDKDATVEGKVVEKDKKKHIESPKVTVK